MKGKRIKLSGQDVQEIFRLKAKGYTNGHIAERYGCSDGYISCVLHRQVYENVYVDPKIMADVNELLIFRKGNGKAAKAEPEQDKDVSYKDRAEAVTEYMMACYALREAERKCEKLGVDPELYTHMLEKISKGAHI